MDSGMFDESRLDHRMLVARLVIPAQIKRHLWRRLTANLAQKSSHSYMAVELRAVGNGTAIEGA